MGKTAAELRQEIEQQRADISRDVDAIGDKVIPSRIVDRRTEAVRSGLRSAKEAVMGSNDPTDRSTSVADRVGGTKDRAVDLTHTAVEGVAGVPDRVRSGTKGNPLAAGLIAFGAGLLAATLIPSSEKEEELVREVQPQLEKAGTMVGEAGRELVDGMRPQVEHAVQEVKQEASDAGQRLTGEAKQAVQDTAESATSAAPS